MKAGLLALLLALVPLAARADTLVDHVNGLTLDGEGRIERFTGLVIGNDGRVAQVLHAGERRPRADFAIDGRQRSLLPGFVLARLALSARALETITPPGIAGPLPPPRPEDRDLALATIQPILLARGITTVTDMGTTIEDWQALRRAGDEGRLAIRVLAYAGGTQAMALIAGPRPTPWLYDDRLRCAGVWLEAPAPLTAAAEVQLKNWISRAAIDHFQPAVHAGAAAAPAVARAFEELAQTYKGDRRWRTETSAPGDALPEPLTEMAGALDRVAVLRGYSVEPARQAFAEGRVGRIAVGARADFVLLDVDPELASAGELRAARVLETWVNGQRVWVRPGGGQREPAAEGR